MIAKLGRNINYITFLLDFGAHFLTIWRGYFFLFIGTKKAI